MVFILGSTAFTVVGDSILAEHFRKILSGFLPQIGRQILFLSRRGIAGMGWPAIHFTRRLPYRQRSFLWWARNCFAVNSAMRKTRQSFDRSRSTALPKISSVPSTIMAISAHRTAAKHICTSKRFIFYVYMPFIELMLLKKNSTLAHCSAVERDGRCILFPAMGGCRKNKHHEPILDKGWEVSVRWFLCHQQQRQCVNSSAPMHIYKYHEVQSPELIAKMLSQLTPPTERSGVLLANSKNRTGLSAGSAPRKFLARTNKRRRKIWGVVSHASANELQ